MHKCFSYPLKAGNKEHILHKLCPVVSSPAAVQRCATLRSPAPLSARSVRRWGSASPRDHAVSYPSLHISSCVFLKSRAQTIWGGGRFDSTVTPHRLICQNIQVPQLMLRHLPRLFGNSLNFLLFGAQSFKLNINFIP